MRLLHAQTFELQDFVDSELPAFAILSYAHSKSNKQNDELSTASWAFDRKRGWRLPTDGILAQACRKAVTLNVAYLWLWSVCVDDSSSVALEEAVNSSFRWLRKSTVCIAYLFDLPAEGPLYDEHVWRSCRYWSSAWTLQELIAPSCVVFFDAEWRQRGSKSSPELLPILSSITGIAKGVLLDCSAIADTALAVRMSWSARRSANREEDVAYSLVGICGVAMPVCYGEGAERAFLRLQEVLLQDSRDGSILAWCDPVKDHGIRGLLAQSPSQFSHFLKASELAWKQPWRFDGEISFGSKGVRIQSWAITVGACIILEIGRVMRSMDSYRRVGIRLRYLDGVYVRVDPDSLVDISETGFPRIFYVARHVDLAVSDTALPQLGSARSSTWPHRQDYRHREPKKLALRINSRSDSAAKDDFCHIPVELASTRIKRDRSGHPKGLRRRMSPATDLDFCSYSEESEETQENDDSSDSSFVDGSNFDDSSEGLSSCSLDIGKHGDLDSKLGNKESRDTMKQDLYSSFRLWKISVQSATSPAATGPPYKRTKLTDGASTPMLEEQDSDDPQLVVFSRLKRSFHFACPFYVVNPTRHFHCLHKHDFRSIGAVIRHLQKHHTEPPYCPICCQVFTNIWDRNEHARQAACGYRAIANVEGLNELQKARLVQGDDPRLSKAARWLRVFTTVFPSLDVRPEPYLKEGLGLELSLAKEFWASRRQHCISQCLSDHDQLHLQGTKQDDLINALQSRARDDFLDEVVHGYHADQVGGRS